MPKRSRKNATTNNNIQNPSRKREGERKSEFSTSENPVIFLDKINIEILRNIFRNPDIKSSEISEKIDIPLSTIQRRRGRIENSAVLKKSFVIDFHRLGMRVADLLIKITKGDIETIVSEIVKQHSKSILEITVRLGQPDINIVVRIAYKDNDEIYEIMRTFNTIEHLESIQWSEILKEVTIDRHGLIENLFSRVKTI
jgi:DNA-binding Lrp family transcriptional regulator